MNPKDQGELLSKASSELVSVEGCCQDIGPKDKKKKKKQGGKAEVCQTKQDMDWKSGKCLLWVINPNVKRMI